MFALCSAWPMLVMGSRTFSNTAEMILFAITLYVCVLYPNVCVCVCVCVYVRVCVLVCVCVRSIYFDVEGVLCFSFIQKYAAEHANQANTHATNCNTNTNNNNNNNNNNNSNNNNNNNYNNNTTMTTTTNNNHNNTTTNSNNNHK